MYPSPSFDDYQYLDNHVSSTLPPTPSSSSDYLEGNPNHHAYHFVYNYFTTYLYKIRTLFKKKKKQKSTQYHYHIYIVS